MKAVMHNGGCRESDHLTAPGGSHWVFWYHANEMASHWGHRLILSRGIGAARALTMAREHYSGAPYLDGEVTACHKCYGGAEDR